MAKKQFDFVIVGGGMSGCLMAKALDRMGNPSIALIEANPSVGPAAALSQYGFGSDEISFLPVDASTDRALDFVESLMGHAIARNASEDPPLTFEKGDMQPFFGFGEKVPAEVDELIPYLNPHRMDTNPHPSRWFSLMRESMPAEVFTRSQVTKIEIDQGLAKAVVINGDQRIEAQTIILCVPPTEILKLIPTTAIDPKISQKLSKSKLWTSVCLDLVHPKLLGPNETTLILTGGESSVCLGQFRTTHTGHNISQWMSFIEGDEFDEEKTAGSLREMKRLIKRAYPEALENLVSERLVVRTNSHGTIALKLEDDFSLPGLENVWLCSGLLRAEKNLVGSILQAQRVANSIQMVRSQAGVESTPQASF